MPGFLYGTPGMPLKRGFPRRILAARIGPTPGSARRLIRMISETGHGEEIIRNGSYPAERRIK